MTDRGRHVARYLQWTSVRVVFGGSLDLTLVFIGEQFAIALAVFRCAIRS